ERSCAVLAKRLVLTTSHCAMRHGGRGGAKCRGGLAPVGPLHRPHVRDPLTELRQAVERFWPLLSRADRERLIDWLIEHIADPPTSAVRLKFIAMDRAQPRRQSTSG